VRHVVVAYAAPEQYGDGRHPSASAAVIPDCLGCRDAGDDAFLILAGIDPGDLSDVDHGRSVSGAADRFEHMAASRPVRIQRRMKRVKTILHLVTEIEDFLLSSFEEPRCGNPGLLLKAIIRYIIT